MVFPVPEKLTSMHHFISNKFGMKTYHINIDLLKNNFNFNTLSKIPKKSIVLFEDIDPVIIRPGRIDHVIEFGNCTEKQIRNLCEIYKYNY